MAFWDGWDGDSARPVAPGYSTEIITHTSGRYEVRCTPDGEVVSFKKLPPEKLVEKVIITIKSEHHEVGLAELARLIKGGARITSIQASDMSAKHAAIIAEIERHTAEMIALPVEELRRTLTESEQETEENWLGISDWLLRPTV